MGAIANGTHYLNQKLITELNISQSAITKTIQSEQEELERREILYRGNAPPPDFSNKTIMLIDDGIATGASARVAIKTLRASHPQKIILAIPVAAESTCKALKPLVDELICLEQPADLQAVGLWYDDFSQTTDEEVINLRYNQRP